MVFLALFSLLTSLDLNAFAAEVGPVRMIEIKSEQYPGETYHLGYFENEDHSISRVFYEDNAHRFRAFSFSELVQPVPIIQVTSGGTVYDLVRISMRPEFRNGNLVIDMSYMKNGLFKNRKSAIFKMIFNAQSQKFELHDHSNDQLITRAYVTTNYWGNIAVGIDQIQVSR